MFYNTEKEDLQYMNKEFGTIIINGKIVDLDKISIEETEKLNEEIYKSEVELRKEVNDNISKILI